MLCVSPLMCLCCTLPYVPLLCTDAVTLLQAPAVPATSADLREVRAGHVHPAGAWCGGRRRLFLRVLQRGHRSLLQAGAATPSTPTLRVTPDARASSRPWILEVGGSALEGHGRRGRPTGVDDHSSDSDIYFVILQMLSKEWLVISRVKLLEASFHLSGLFFFSFLDK